MSDIRLIYLIDCQFLDRQGLPNSVDLDQTAQNIVCHSVGTFWTHYCMVKPHCSNSRIIIAIFFMCPIFTVSHLPFTTYVWQLAETFQDNDFGQTSAVFLTLYNICVTVGWDLSWQRLQPDFSSISCLVQHMCDSWLRLVLTATSARLQQYFLPCTTYVWQLAETCHDNDFGQTSDFLPCTTYVWHLVETCLDSDFSQTSAVFLTL